MSATSKIDDLKLKESLRRARQRRTLTHLFDAAVPEHVRYEGVVNTNEQSIVTPVEIGKHNLSPFILHLASAMPSPEELLAQEDFTPIRLNLLHAMRPERIEQVVVNHVNDLVLEQHEIRSQLAEDYAVSSPSMIYEPLLIDHPRSFDVLLPYARGIRLPPTFTLTMQSAFEPAPMPDDIFSYFDLPEDEEESIVLRNEDDSDVLDLDIIESELETDTESVPQGFNSGDSTSHQPSATWMPFGWKRAIAGFVAISFVFVLPLHAMNLVQELREAKTTIETSSFNAVNLFNDGTTAASLQDTALAQNFFTDAGRKFAQAQTTIDQLGAGTQLLLSAVPTTRGSYKTGEALVSAGTSLSRAASRLTQGLEEIQNDVNPTPVSRSQLLRTFMNSALPHVEDANRTIEQLNSNDIPEAYRDQFTQLQTSLPLLMASMYDLEEMARFAETVLGAQGSKRYLLIFQNNTEMRATGGFMGSFAEIKVNNGVLEHLNVPGGGTYDLQGYLKTSLIAPKPLQLLKARWEFQDANWFPDFPTSARQMIQFYNDSGGPSLDGVIAVNAQYVVDLLKLLGPIEMPDYDRVIDSENFMFEAQKIVELEYDKVENKPKQFIGDLAPMLIDRAVETSSERFMEFVDILGKGLAKRDIQVYLTDDTLQQTILARGWGGAILQTAGDYLMIVDSNLGGGKTDAVIRQRANLDVRIDDNGTITNTLTITRTHNGLKNALFSGVNNVNFLRVYVPKGATLLSASGFSIPDVRLFEEPSANWTIDDDVYYNVAKEKIDPASGTAIFEESGKTVFGNWVQTAPGDTSTVRFVYTLPFSINTLNAQSWNDQFKKLLGIPKTERYTLVVQKQSGVMDRTTEVRFETPFNLSTIWSSFDDRATFTNESDTFIGLLLLANTL